MPPFERGDSVPLMPGRSSSSSAESCVQVQQDECGSSLLYKDKGDKDPSSSSSVVNSSNKALQLLTLVQLNTEMSSWSDRYEQEESNARIQKLRRNKRRAEKGICEVQKTIETLQEENERLRTNNQALVAREAEYAKMMRKASELLDSIHRGENKDREDFSRNSKEEDSSNSSSIIAERRDDDSSKIERDSLASFQSSLLKKGHLYNQSTNQFLIDEKERVIAEMSTSIEAMEMQIEELKQEKEELIAQSEAQSENIASLQEQDELKVAKIDILESMVKKMVQSLLKQEQGNGESSSGALLAKFQLPWAKQEEKDCLSRILKSRRRVQHLKDSYGEDNVASSPDPPGKNDVDQTDSNDNIVVDQKTTMKDEPASYRESIRERFFPSRNHIELAVTSKNPPGGNPESTTTSSKKSSDCDSLVTCSLSSTTKDGASSTKMTYDLDASGLLVSKDPIPDVKSGSKNTESSQTALDFTLSDTPPPSIASTNDANDSPSKKEEDGIECMVGAAQQSFRSNLHIAHPNNTDTPPADQRSDINKKDISSGDDTNQQSVLSSPRIGKLCTSDIAAALQTIDKQIISAKNELRSIRATKKTASYEHKDRKDLQRKSADKSDDATTKEQISTSNERPETRSIPSSCSNYDSIVGNEPESTEEAGHGNIMQEYIDPKSEQADDGNIVQESIAPKSIERQATTVTATIPGPQAVKRLQPPSYGERRFNMERFRLAKQEMEDLKRTAALGTCMSAFSSDNDYRSKEEQGAASNTAARAPTCINRSCKSGAENDDVDDDKKVLQCMDGQDSLKTSTKRSDVEVTCGPTEKTVETVLVKQHDVAAESSTKLPTKRPPTGSSLARNRFNNRRFYKRKAKTRLNGVNV